MMTRKDLIIATLSTFCLTSALFMIIPIESSPNVRDYNPWIDFNDDGKIDLTDVLATHLAYGALGDSTKNVNVTDWQLKYRIDSFKGINFTWQDYGSTGHYTSLEGMAEGCSRLSVQITVYTWSPEGPYWTNVSLEWAVWVIQKPAGSWGTNNKPIPESDTAKVSFYINNSMTLVGVSDPIEVQAPFYQLGLEVHSESENGWVLMDIYVYLRNE